MIPVLTVRDRWAHAMFDPEPGRKNLENRVWRPQNPRNPGRIAIHVGLAVDVLSFDFTGPITPDEERSRGHIIGTVELDGCHDAGSPGCEANRCYDNPWAFWQVPGDPDRIRQQLPSIVHWMLSEPRRFVTPIRARGALGLWVPDPSLAYLIETAEVRP